MAMEIFKKTSLSMWRSIAKLVKDSIIFIDNYSAECLHWCGGVDLLFEHGAVCVKEFSSFESGNSNQSKAVFILSSPIAGETESILEDIIKSSSFSKCLLVCGLDSQVHSYACGDESFNEMYFEELCAKVSRWNKHKKCSAEAIHFPIFLAPIADNAFVTPAFDMLFPVQKHDLDKLEIPGGGLNATSLQDLHFYMFPKEYRTLLRMTAGSFRSFSHNLQCKEEIFAVGPTSKVLSIQLSNLSNQSKSSYPNKIGILFVDRTLDLMSAVTRSEKSLVDQLLAILPGLPCHYNNVAIDMSLLCTAQSSRIDDDLIYSGCLVPDSKTLPLLSHSINSKSKDSVNMVGEKLITAVEEEGLDEDLELDKLDSLQAMKSLVQAFQGNPGGILYNAALLQFALAVVQLLEDPILKAWKTLSTKEKLILQQLGDDEPDGVVRSLSRIAEEESMCFQDILSLLIYASYALGACGDSRKTLSGMIHKVLSKTEFSAFSESFVTRYNLSEKGWDDSSKLSSISDDITDTITDVRSNYLEQMGILRLSEIEPPLHRPLLPQVVERIFDPNKPELQPDIEHVTTGRTDLLKMGMSMFRKVVPPRPCDYPVLVIYVVGGITTTEVAQINRALEKYSGSNCQVVIGSNRLVSPSDIVDSVFFDDNLRPDVRC